MVDSDGMKVCPRCGENKPAGDNFYREKSRPDGYDVYCKGCNHNKYRDRFEKDPELVREQGRAREAKKKAEEPERYKEIRDGINARANAKTKTKTKIKRIERLGDVANGERRCADCREIKPLSEFEKDKRRGGGVGSYCGVCGAKRQAARQLVWRERNRDALLERSRQRKATPEFKAWEAEWRKRPEVAERFRLRDQLRMRGSRRIDGGNRIATRAWRLLLQAFDGHCCYCPSAEKMTVEHLTPLSRGGTNDIGNIAPACAACNLTKRAKTAEEYAPTRAAEIRRRAFLVCEALAA